MTKWINQNDLAPTSFNNDGTAGAGGIKVNTGAGSDVKAAIDAAVAAAVGGGTAPTGTAGGNLAGTYPNPTFSAAGNAAINALIASAVASLPADKYISSMASYNAATNIATFNLNGGGTVNVDFTALVNDAVASIQFATAVDLAAGTAGKAVDAALAKSDLLSKTDTAPQTMAGNVNWVAGKAPYWGSALSRMDMDGAANTWDANALPPYAGQFHITSSVPATFNTFGGARQCFIHRMVHGSGYGGSYNIDIAFDLYGAAPVWRSNNGSVGAWTPLGSSGSGLGVNQTRQDVTASRAAGVPYPNTTGAPIEVGITSTGIGQNKISVSGKAISWIYSGGGITCILKAIILPNEAYTYTGDPIIDWYEIR